MIDISTPHHVWPNHTDRDLPAAGRVSIRHMHTRSCGTGTWCITVDFNDAETDRIFVGKVESWHIDKPTPQTVTEWATKAFAQLGLTDAHVTLDVAAWDRVERDGDTTGVGDLTGLLPDGGRLGQHWVDTSTDPDREGFTRAEVVAATLRG